MTKPTEDTGVSTSHQRVPVRTLTKSIVFTIVTVLATLVLAATIRNTSGGPATTYHAIFTDATSLNKGDDVRMAGVKVGTVKDIEVDKRMARVTFTISTAVKLERGSTAQLRFRNLVGQRYIDVEQPTPAPAGEVATLPAGYTFDVDHTKPALDLTLLFNGFQPLLQMLDAKDVNNLSAQIISVFQGEGTTVDSLLSSTASLTTTLADKDKVIGELITSLSSVLDTVNQRSGQLDTTIVTLQQLVSGLAADRATIGNTLSGLGDLTTSVADLLHQGRAPLKRSIASLGKLSGNLAAAQPTVDHFLKTLPTKLDQIGRIGSYGSWLNFYECSIQGRIPMPEGYVGDLGAKPVAARCR
jgi:phospholipid/cholesterol/gamma-HCH transport system substrate-binding protein